MPHVPHRSLVIGTVSATLVLLIDFWLKARFLAEGEGVIEPIIPGMLGLTLHKNFGIVGNLPLPAAVVVPLTIGILAFCAYWLWKVHRDHSALAASLVVLILGGLGNLVDRILHGFTTDFLVLFERSVINLADVLIVLGILGVLLFHRPNHSPSHS